MLDKAIIYFNGEINRNSVHYLLNAISTYSLKGIKNIDIALNSHGGESDAGISAYYMLKNLSKNISINTINISQCDSAAVLLYLSGNKKYAIKNSRFLIHQSASSINQMKETDIINELNNLKSINKQYLDIIQIYLKISDTEYYNGKRIITSEPIDNFINDVVDCLEDGYKYHWYITSTDYAHIFEDKDV